MQEWDDEIDKKYGRLTILDIKKEKGKFFAYCRCICGNEKNINIWSIKSGRTQSCGCLHRENISKQMKKHGMLNTRLYRIWQNIKNRCLNYKNKGYKNYGGRGISICEDWVNDFMKFYTWSMKNGYNENLTIDRIDNNKNYEPSNCRWVNKHIQNANQRVCKNNKSKYKNISWDKCTNKWRVNIVVNNKVIRLGRFINKKDALEKRNNFIRENGLYEYGIQEWRGE